MNIHAKFYEDWLVHSKVIMRHTDRQMLNSRIETRTLRLFYKKKRNKQFTNTYFVIFHVFGLLVNLQTPRLQGEYSYESLY